MTTLYYGDIGHEPRLEPPDPDAPPRCPICGEECETFYICDDEVIGCDRCTEAVDAIDYTDKLFCDF